MRLTARAALAIAILLAPLVARGQVTQGPGVTSLNSRRGNVTIQPSDLPSPTVYPFTGDGTTVSFPLPSPIDPTRVAVSVGGVGQGPGSFAIASTLTLAAPAPVGAPVSVVAGGIPVASPSTLSGAPVVYDCTGMESRRASPCPPRHHPSPATASRSAASCSPGRPAR